jgi:hypothetical protein
VGEERVITHGDRGLRAAHVPNCSGPTLLLTCLSVWQESCKYKHSLVVSAHFQVSNPLFSPP